MGVAKSPTKEDIKKARAADPARKDDKDAPKHGEKGQPTQGSTAPGAGAPAAGTGPTAKT
jgi:hypothetical protein